VAKHARNAGGEQGEGVAGGGGGEEGVEVFDVGTGTGTLAILAAHAGAAAVTSCDVPTYLATLST
jgi:ribosomal protein L11 methylase PrmA